MLKTEELLVKIRELKPLIKKQYKVRNIELFGSIIREDKTENSDIDILVDFEEGADLFDMAGLATFLEEKLKLRVDVVPKRALREEIRESVLREAVPI